MHPRDRQLATLAAALVPASAAALLRYLSSPDSSKIQAYAEVLSARSRTERLGALAQVLSQDLEERERARRAVAVAERPLLARMLLTRVPLVVMTQDTGCHPILGRLCLEKQ